MQAQNPLTNKYICSRVRLGNYVPNIAVLADETLCIVAKIQPTTSTGHSTPVQTTEGQSFYNDLKLQNCHV